MGFPSLSWSCRDPFLLNAGVRLFCRFPWLPPFCGPILPPRPQRLELTRQGRVALCFSSWFAVCSCLFLLVSSRLPFRRPSRLLMWNRIANRFGYCKRFYPAKIKQAFCAYRRQKLQSTRANARVGLLPDWARRELLEKYRE